MNPPDMPVTGRLAGRVALVTGAGSCAPGWGNGRATAVLFSRAGAHVVVTDRDLPAAEATATLIREEGGACDVAALDVLDEEETNRIVAETVARHGRLDILHCNVGRGAPGGPIEMSVETFRAQLDINCTSVFIGSKAVLPVMVRQGRGVINTVGSIGGLRHLGHDHAGYSAGKAALVQLTRQIAVRHAPDGIRANTIIPGMMDTPLIAHRIARQGNRGDANAIQEEARRRVPMGRRGDAWDVAYAALFLASDEARYITGTELLVDGGFMSKTV
ncbi:SDR family NAD(P)-dependent oxidoreductase [Sabulicella rubraurantiaca]|uniref:SDR family NAD(P)-dependent oxidoreductase n=1 Tax=Sabulicella rubraurantiaca TaxID=2811429 RepID=UPI001F41558C|nr:SDR family NAD(P)-dependent oxidoreductase [Sabulicella rubraurantiaca]